MSTQRFLLKEKTSLLIKWFVFIVLIAVFEQCQSSAKKNQNRNSEVKSITPKTIADKKSQIIDTGQVWFNITVKKNDTLYLHYEGQWSWLLSSNNFSTLQLSGAKDPMAVSHTVTIYMRGLTTGKFPVTLQGEKVSIVISPVVNGSFDIPILPTEGFLNITKNTGKLLSGSFEAKAVDDKNDQYILTGDFLNAIVHDADNPDSQ